MQIGVDSFAALVPDPITGRTVTAQQRMAHLLEEIELADEVGLDHFGLGEHHRAGIAGRRNYSACSHPCQR